ncbi:MAG: hypothetical protein LKG56_03720 [Lachnospiraceae bacterium]|jgi:hypothetical protein|nr:hypothetical protein [Lachnospiraceae bacterium]MCH4030502.1 hypothetical protein [Lachnospiraceae bacterium]MCH4069712.1 hypothetical protein [Lachnospiraceae bacterium]MCH4107350.1 hypothetical protein [Lachnospiraceae bacterium]MCI1301796.1 hypothetical protein [Lachnospiraceae bacterium]
MKMKCNKGESGYLQEKQKRAWIYVVLFAAVIAALLVIGILIWGSNQNVLTVAAIVLVLPAARFGVNLIMLASKKPSDAGVIRQTDKTAPDLIRLYDLVIGTSKKPVGTEAVVISDSALCIYETQKDTDLDFLTAQVNNFLHGDSIFINVNVYNDRDKFMKRIAFLQQSLEKSGKELRADRVGKIKNSLCAMCL